MLNFWSDFGHEERLGQEARGAAASGREQSARSKGSSFALQVERDGGSVPESRSPRSLTRCREYFEENVTPNEAGMQELKRPCRHLLKYPDLCQVLVRQAWYNKVARVVSDHAGDAVTRRSATGVVALYGSHVLKHPSNAQGSSQVQMKDTSSR